MGLVHTAAATYVVVAAVSLALRMAVTFAGPDRLDHHAIDMAIRAQKMHSLNRSSPSDALTAMQRLAAAQATLQCARQMSTDAQLESGCQVDVARLGKVLIREISALHQTAEKKLQDSATKN